MYKHMNVCIHRTQMDIFRVLIALNLAVLKLLLVYVHLLGF
jgi:hypothetical protein